MRDASYSAGGLHAQHGVPCPCMSIDSYAIIRGFRVQGACLVKGRMTGQADTE